jgi:hypothetical protein
VTERPTSSARSLFGRVIRFLGSFGLACSLFLALFVVVLIGTVQTQFIAVHDVQAKYFESFFFVQSVFGVPVPFPGGVLLLGILLVNLLVGGILRMRWSLRTAGIFVTHGGIVLLLVGSTIEFLGSDKGHLVLAEGASTDRFESYTDWELAVFDVAGDREWVIPQDDLLRADGAGKRFTAPDLPIEVRVSGYSRNTAPRWARHEGEGAEGVVIEVRRPDPEKAEANAPGAYVEAMPTTGGVAARGVLWGRALAPFTTEVGGRTFVFDLRRRSWTLPYRVTLTRAIEEKHVGTSTASRYSSYVRLDADGDARDAHITMNVPLRDRGHTLYQSTFHRRADGTVESGLAVVRNPTDRVPLIACLVIAGGMLLHFVVKLVLYLTAQSRRRTALADVATA